MKMKALSVRQPWASLLLGTSPVEPGVLKTIETRTWKTDYRGRLLVVSSKQPTDQGPAGVAIGTVEVVECRPMTKADEEAACCDLYLGAYAWVVRDPRPCHPFPVRGRLYLYEVEVPDEDICFECGDLLQVAGGVTFCRECKGP